MASPTDPPVSTGPKELIEDAGGIVGSLPRSSDDRAQQIATRLRDSVLRSLNDAAAGRTGRALRDAPAVAPGPAAPSRLEERIWELARAATAARVASPDMPEVAEAVAALQDLALSAGQDADEAASRLAELESLHRPSCRRRSRTCATVRTW